ncbi:MAG: hypothetical protein OXI11_07040 [Gammaproteobacteria bacterium]|nr:hypothetical protein [Gammaproteobacteria bacterium]
MSDRSIYRREALIRSAQPEALDDLLRVTAPLERVFLLAFGVSILFVLVAAAAFLN